MLSPGSKGWILKYQDLLHKGEISVHLEIPPGISKDHFTHLQLSKSGILFGFATEMLFSQHVLGIEKWTQDERLKMLLFEAHLFVYLLNGGNQTELDDFVDALIDFYGKNNSKSLKKVMTFFLKESKTEQLESILDKRIDVKSNLIEKSFLLSNLNNLFIYLDVILFHQYLKNKRQQPKLNYGDLAEEALKTIALAAQSDQTIDSRERKMFEFFLTSANLSDKRKDNLIHFLETENNSIAELNLVRFTDWLYRRYLLDLAFLTIFTNAEADEKEISFLQKLCDALQLPLTELDETMVMVEHFVLKNNQQISALMDSRTYERMYSNVSKRWVKILGRNKDKLATELKQSKELVFLIKKSTTNELSSEEKEKVKTQFLDLVKSVPALAIFLLPGGALLLPIVLKIIPDLVPSAFRDNEIDD